MKTRFSLATSVLAVAALTAPALLTACANKDTPPPKPASGSATGATSADDMHDTFLVLDKIKEALVVGDLAAIKESAAVLQGKDVTNTPEPGREYVSAFYERAAVLYGARDLGVATRAATSMAQNCGYCHEANSVEIGLTAPPRPEAVPDPWDKTQDEQIAHMRLHQWGVDRMWEALTAPSDEMWSQGVDAFRTEAATPADGDESSGETVSPSLKRMGELAHQLGSIAGEATDDQRAAALADVMTLCTTCHEVVR